MREKEKMLNGLMYDANYDKELADERIKCKCLCSRYNALSPDKTEKNYSVKFLEKQVKIFGLSRISGVTTVIIQKSAKTSIRTIIV